MTCLRLFKTTPAAAAVLAAGFALTEPAGATDFLRCRDWHGEIPGCDPYAYEYRPPRYYPFYGSSYWRPAETYLPPDYSYVPPPYGKAWGYPARRVPVEPRERLEWWEHLRPW